MMILVRNFAEFVTEEDLKARFLKYGEISSVRIVLDKTIDEPRKLGFVDMPNEAEAQAAIKALHRSKFQKEIIRVTKANPRFGPDYYLGNTSPQIPTPADKPAVPARPVYESFAQKAKPDFKFGAKRRQHTDKRDAANSEFQRNNRPEYPRGDRPYSSNRSADGKRTYGHFQKRDGARPYSAPQGQRSYGSQDLKDRGGMPVQRDGARHDYKPRSERPYNRNSSGESARPYGHYQKRDGARPYSAPQGERSYGSQGSKDRGARPSSGFPHRDGTRPEYKPRSERPYNRNSSGESARPYGHFQKREGARPYSAPRGERSRVYQGSKDRGARPASGFSQRDGARAEYKPRSERPFGRSSSGESGKPHGHFHKREGGKSGPAEYGKRIHSK